MRLVAPDFSQIEGLDYYGTFSPVVKLALTSIILGVVAREDLHLHQMNVVTAFFNEDLAEEVNTKQPPSYKQCDASRAVHKLTVALYSWKQALRQ